MRARRTGPRGEGPGVLAAPVCQDPGEACISVGSLWLPAGDPPIPGADSERREEDSFDSDSTATLLK